MEGRGNGGETYGFLLKTALVCIANGHLFGNIDSYKLHSGSFSRRFFGKKRKDILI